jgi:histidinol dehydrogenase
MITRLTSTDPQFLARLDAISNWSGDDTRAVEATVRAILDDVRHRGDAALLEYTNRFDRRQVETMDELVLPAAALDAAWASVDADAARALEDAAARIVEFHEHQREQSWQYTDSSGSVLGQQITPVDRAGLYVPGGKAAYPSSVLMNALPAKVAGVPEVVMTVPAPDNHVDPLVLAAARVAGVDKVVTVGGAQAVAALAYGTATVPSVDKIVGPGNIYVATAKRMVFGVVGIDMVAGPSEILVVSDGSVSPEWLAMDLFAQAEHDEDARAVLVSPDLAHLDAVAEAIERLLPQMERREIIAAALRSRGALIQVNDLDEALSVVNRLAPEHLELAVQDPQALVPRVRHAGAIFLGALSPEAFGDYCAGPNHVLPTARTARFSSPLGVYDFQKRSSIIGISVAGARELAPLAATLARGEGLTAHARSAEYRGGNAITGAVTQ